MNSVNGQAGEQGQGRCDRDDLRISLGAYVLGALDAAESRLVRGHLLDCVSCRKAYGELLEVRSVLDRAITTETAAPSPAPTAPRSPAARRTRRAPIHGRRRLGLAAAGVLLAGTAGVGGALLIGNQSGTPAGTHVVAATGLYGMTASIQFHPAPWGTAVQVTMSNIPSNYTCTLTAIGKDGHVEVASTWNSGPHGGTVTVPGAVSIPAASIDHFDVAIPPGITLVVPAG